MSDLSPRFCVFFKNEEFVVLYGEDMWADKKVFYDFHHRILEELCQKVESYGFPLEVEDWHERTSITLHNEIDLNQWLKEYHPIESCVHLREKQERVKRLI